MNKCRKARPAIKEKNSRSKSSVHRYLINNSGLENNMEFLKVFQHIQLLLMFIAEVTDFVFILNILTIEDYVLYGMNF